MRLISRYLGLITLIILLVGVASPSSARIYLVDFDEREAEFIMLQAINVIRYNEGLPLLLPDNRLALSCRRHAMDMARRDYFDHYSPDGVNPSDRARRVGVPNPISENIGITRTFGRTLPDVVDLLMEGFMNSPDHRRNLLDPTVTHVGIGFYQDKDEINQRLASGRDPDSNYQGYGTVLVVQDFYRRQVELLEPSPYKGYTKPGEFMTVQLGFLDDVEEAFLRISPANNPNGTFDIPMTRAEKSFRARFAIGAEGDFKIGIYANSASADWYYREQGQLDLTVKAF